MANKEDVANTWLHMIAKYIFTHGQRCMSHIEDIHALIYDT